MISSTTILVATVLLNVASGYGAPLRITPSRSIETRGKVDSSVSADILRRVNVEDNLGRSFLGATGDQDHVTAQTPLHHALQVVQRTRLKTRLKVALTTTLKTHLKVVLMAQTRPRLEVVLTAQTRPRPEAAPMAQTRPRPEVAPMAQTRPHLGVAPTF
ncbi:hypothetical protein P691DRAFT_453317 [Macrolepiota fuliginosa MF-IS2]|uniref:Uncharacterized protein n=1 Tax=Macrolepiota fuliginosa MF-IS2 TaxID=1400762 RepID=A0A9P6BYU5_9AGAR|nr:hypothetical protein P691DRAFT_453317 [Macrolepiota fuliginosa MF-IS2]